jgi:hypothetical protein
MATGIQSRIDISATTYTTLSTTAASGKVQVLTVSICNRNGSPVTIHLAVVASGAGSPGLADYIEYNAAVNANSVLERTGIVVPINYVLMGYSSTANVSFVVFGVEDTATGVMGKVDLGAGAYNNMISTPAANRFQAVTANFTNRTASIINIRLAISTSPGGPAAGEYIEYDYPLPAGGVLERTGLLITNGYYISAYAASAGVSSVVWGVDDAI